MQDTDMGQATSSASAGRQGGDYDDVPPPTFDSAAAADALVAAADAVRARYSAPLAAAVPSLTSGLDTRVCVADAEVALPLWRQHVGNAAATLDDMCASVARSAPAPPSSHPLLLSARNFVANAAAVVARQDARLARLRNQAAQVARDTAALQAIVDSLLSSDALRAALADCSAVLAAARERLAAATAATSMAAVATATTAADGGLSGGGRNAYTLHQALETAVADDDDAPRCIVATDGASPPPAFFTCGPSLLDMRVFGNVTRALHALTMRSTRVESALVDAQLQLEAALSKLTSVRDALRLLAASSDVPDNELATLHDLGRRVSECTAAVAAVNAEAAAAAATAAATTNETTMATAAANAAATLARSPSPPPPSSPASPPPPPPRLSPDLKSESMSETVSETKPEPPAAAAAAVPTAAAAVAAEVATSLSALQPAARAAAAQGLLDMIKAVVARRDEAAMAAEADSLPLPRGLTAREVEFSGQNVLFIKNLMTGVFTAVYGGAAPESVAKDAYLRQPDVEAALLRSAPRRALIVRRALAARDGVGDVVTRALRAYIDTSALLRRVRGF